MIDLRSDTVTRPTGAMRDAMRTAEVGDDVYGEDPTVNRLQEVAAKLTGMEAALFTPSGTMGNLASLLAHCARGAEVVVGDEAHIYHYEAGGASALGGLVFHPVRTEPDGSLAEASIEAAIRPSARNAHFAPAGVICLENTHNRMGGTVTPPEHTAGVAALASRHGLPVHLDGARIFNASVSLRRPVVHWTRHVDSVQFCLSKGLGAPAGSLIAGSRAFVDRAWRVRKMLGGGMRQAGVLAAAGLVALETMVERLAEDHAHARDLAEALAAVDGIAIDLARVQTNIVVFEPPPDWNPEGFLTAAAQAGVLLTPFGGRRVRAMTHLDVSGPECEQAASVIARLIRRGPVA